MKLFVSDRISTPLLMWFTNEAPIKYDQWGPTHSPQAWGKTEYIFITHSSSSQQLFIALETNMSLGHVLGWLWEMNPLYNEEWSTVTACKYSKQQNIFFLMINPVSAIVNCSTACTNLKCIVIWKTKKQKWEHFKLTHLQNQQLWIIIISDLIQCNAQTLSSLGPTGN